MLTRPTIAIFEADPTIAAVIAELLELAGHAVQCYARSAHLLCRMSQVRPDIVLLDGTNPIRYDGWIIFDVLRGIDPSARPCLDPPLHVCQP